MLAYGHSRRKSTTNFKGFVELIENISNWYDAETTF